MNYAQESTLCPSVGKASHGALKRDEASSERSPSSHLNSGTVKSFPVMAAHGSKLGRSSCNTYHPHPCRDHMLSKWVLEAAGRVVKKFPPPR